MDFGGLFELIEQFMSSARFYPILGLIGMDLVLGVSVAIKEGEFEWEKLGRFYQTSVLPYILAYLGIFIALQFVPESVGFIADGLDVLVFAAIISRLVSSIVGHLLKLDIELG